MPGTRFCAKAGEPEIIQEIRKISACSNLRIHYQDLVMKTILLIAMTIAAVLSSSCNTFIGMGRDLRIAGESMEKTADKASGGSGGGSDHGGAPIY
jgi:predicted small secreted protein